MWYVKYFLNILDNFVYFSLFHLFLADVQLSEYVSSAEQVTETDKRNGKRKVTSPYFEFYLCPKDNVRRCYALALRRGKFSKNLQKRGGVCMYIEKNHICFDNSDIKLGTN